jgi:hypothetical protein
MDIWNLHAVRSGSPDRAGRVGGVPWVSGVLHFAALNESVHSTLSPHLYVREGSNLRLPLWEARKYGLADPVPMDASATALSSGAKWHSISTDVCRRVPKKTCETFLPHFPASFRAEHARAIRCNIYGSWNNPLLVLGQNNSPASKFPTPQSDVRPLRSVHWMNLEIK